MIKTIDDLIKKARISWVISIDDDNSSEKTDTLDKSLIIRQIATTPETYLELLTQIDVDLTMIIELDDVDDRVELLKDFLSKIGDKDWDIITQALSQEKRETPIQRIIKSWNKKGLINDYIFLPSIKEAKAVLETMPSSWNIDGNNRIMWLIDRDFSAVHEGTEAGIELIKHIAQKELHDSICFLLTAKTDIELKQLSSYINLTSIVSKDKFINMESSTEVISEIIQGLWANYNHLMISQLANYLSIGVDKAKEQLLSLTSPSVRHIIINFPRSEGVSLPETLFRILITLTGREFGEAYGKELDNINQLLNDYSALNVNHEALREEDKKLLFKLRNLEKYDYNINTLRQQIGFGDVFNYKGKLYILLSQPCEIAVRGTGDRNLNEALLVRLCKADEHQQKTGAKHYSTLLRFFDEKSNYWLEFREFILLDFDLLDLCALNNDGVAKVPCEVIENDSINEDDPLFFPYSKKRFDAIKVKMKEKLNRNRIMLEVGRTLNKLAFKMEDIRSVNTEYKRLLRTIDDDNLLEKDGVISFPLNRICRVKEPFSLNLYSEFTTYHSRIGLPGDFVGSQVVGKETKTGT
jgi:hypothetical protein